MKAMILAAGLGTRLRPLTNDRPKALVKVAGRTLLEISLSRLRNFGIRDVIVNVHHFADIVADYLRKNANFGMHIEVSREDVLLDTGGGLKKAAWFFQESPTDAEAPFILHNVDVISTIDLKKMADFHKQRGALATVAVHDRETSRYLLFDEHNELCGRRAGKDGLPEMARPAQKVHALAFSGVHVISPRFLSLLIEDGAFSIISAYLRLAANGERIAAFQADEYYWRDLGKPESLAQAERDWKQKIVNL
jgi:NDP-sugar pyrophosphorylase family protein